MFNSAFISCYTKLGEEERSVLVRALKSVFKHPSTPPDVLQMLLNLCEFAAMNQRQLPIDNLADYALKCHAYAKSLYLKEQEFRQSHAGVSASVTVDDLIAINHRLERHEAAQGLLKISADAQRKTVASSTVRSSSRHMSSTRLTRSSSPTGARRGTSN